MSGEGSIEFVAAVKMGMIVTEEDATLIHTHHDIILSRCSKYDVSPHLLSYMDSHYLITEVHTICVVVTSSNLSLVKGFLDIVGSCLRFCSRCLHAKSNRRKHETTFRAAFIYD